MVAGAGGGGERERGGRERKWVKFARGWWEGEGEGERGGGGERRYVRVVA